MILARDKALVTRHVSLKLAAEGQIVSVPTDIEAKLVSRCNEAKPARQQRARVVCDHESITF